MTTSSYRILPACLLLFVLCIVKTKTYGQAELEPWGNLSGIRVDGQLMEFETSLNLAGKDWSDVKATAKERQRPEYSREVNKQIVATRIDSLYINEVVEDSAEGIAKVSITATAHANMEMKGLFFSVGVPKAAYADGRMQLMGAPGGIRFTSAHRQLNIIFGGAGEVFGPTGMQASRRDTLVYILLKGGHMENNQVIHASFVIQATGTIDRAPIRLAINTTQPGRVFDGLGGNFRLQNPKTDPEVIDYNLQNLRVAWARVEMPWHFWQPDMDSHPIDSAKAGKLHPAVQKAMEMARALSQKGIPLILSAWFPPAWAVQGPLHMRPGPDGVWGNPLDPAHMQEIYRSITDYILCLRQQYGVEIRLFSFNESDLGINIRITPQEHAALIKGLGAYLAAAGLSTKMLLGDNSDATTYPFIYPAMADPGAIPYIGAVSFHSWRGCDSATLEKWADAAGQLHVPLLVAEGSIDAAAWAYPAIFEEPPYALREISLYTRLLAICQPLSILQWQLTADYSDLAGGGIFGNNEPLHPTQRFWNLKQLASTPPGLYAMPLTVTGPDVSGAALGDNAKGRYALHLVNMGAPREAFLTGLPSKVKAVRIFITDKTRAMQEGKTVMVINGEARFMLDAMSYTTLISE
jgi:hypothetical protein